MIYFGVIDFSCLFLREKEKVNSFFLPLMAGALIQVSNISVNWAIMECTRPMRDYVIMRVCADVGQRFDVVIGLLVSVGATTVMAMGESVILRGLKT
jgi:hypothetical protein